MMKFNVDSSSRGNPGPAGCGGVLRNCDGSIFEIFSSPTDFHDSNLAELLAILIVLYVFLKSKKFDCIPLAIESDSTISIN
ncbi:hypothetical protein REPUB_Repub20aG0098200 [Reevesia pubescens]